MELVEMPGTQTPLLPGMDDAQFLGAELLESPLSQESRYTGKIIEKNRERVQQIISARAMGFTVRQICQAFNVSPHTLAELERRHGEKLATLKDRLARKFGVFVELGIDRAISEVGRMDVDRLLISLGIATEKVQLLSGEPTVIVGSEGPKVHTVEALRERLARAKNVTGSALESAEQTRDLEPSPSAST
jgi:transcriptional regulator with XRE-family HTH domain